jgi:hypothetical protein
MKIHSVGFEMLHVSGWTDRHNEGNSHFFRFISVPKNELVIDNILPEFVYPVL